MKHYVLYALQLAIHTNMNMTNMDVFYNPKNK